MHAQQPAGAPLDALTSLRRQLRAGLVTEALASVQRLQATGAVEAKTRDAADLATAEVECRLARGEVKEATAAADELAPYLDLPGLTGALANHAHAEVAAALGDTGLAAEHCAEAGRLLDEAGEEHPDLVPWRLGAALAAVRQGHAGVAEALAREHLSVARAAGSTYATALGLRTLAVVQAGGGFEATLREARALLAGVPAARLVAQVDADLAGALLLHGGAAQRGEAIALLRSAESYAGSEELRPLQARVRRLLELVGEPARRVEAEARAVLTASERRVAALAADGLRNKEIAERLVVTVKAVEWHLSHVYRKLGIRSRKALAASLGVPA